MVGEYFYDGEGKRVKKKSYVGGVHNETTVFVYSSGKLVAEYSTTPPPEPPLATTQFTVTDMLGSPRVILNSLGGVVSRRDFLPFGEEILPDQNVNFRTAGQKYVADRVRQKFTGYQNDEETGLDFAEARMYENRHGRFTAVDPLLASGKSAAPQTFNRYVYVMNNPLTLTDPTGLQAGTKENLQRCGEGRSVCPYTIVGRLVTLNTRDLASTTIEAVHEPISTFAAQVSGIVMPRIGYGLDERMPAELEAMATGAAKLFGEAAYRAIPDSAYFGVSTPFFGFNSEISKDGNGFLGGSLVFGNNITDWLSDIKAAGKELRPKVGLDFGVRYFRENLLESERDSALQGPSGELQVGPVTVVKPADSQAPGSFKVGSLGYSAGGSYTTAKLFDGGDALNKVIENRPRFFR